MRHPSILQPKKRGFALMSRRRHHKISRRGGVARSRSPKEMAAIGRKGAKARWKTIR